MASCSSPTSPAAPVPGSPAPSFALRDQWGAERSLHSLHAERPVLLVFFPFAFSGICTGELTEIRDDLGSFDNESMHVAALSCDPMFALRAWDDREAYFFPLLSDFWPHGDVARRYGVFDEQAGCALRGTFLVDTSGTVVWSHVNALGERRDFASLHPKLSAATAAS